MKQFDYMIEANYLDCGWVIHKACFNLKYASQLIKNYRLHSKNTKFRLIKTTIITKREVLDV